MNFVSNLNSRLNETNSFIDLLDNQLQQLTGCYGQAAQRIDEWIGNFTRVIVTLTEIQKQLLDNYLPTDGRKNLSVEFLDSIQEVCESLGKMWLDLRGQLVKLIDIYMQRDDCRQLKEEIETHFGVLIKRTWIVTLQPPQVLRTNTRFSAILRCLTGSLITPGPMELVKVRAAILCESQALMLQNSSSYPQSQSRDPLNSTLCSGALTNRETVLLRASCGMYDAKFNGMSLKKISRSERRATNSVTEEKFGILFTSEVSCADGELTYNVQVFSLPIVVVVHLNQETSAWATVVWDYHFATSNRLPFEVPDKVSWVNFAQMLSYRFNTECEGYLDQRDLQFLAAKVLRATTALNYDLMYVTWSKFAKEPLPGMSFTFWEWFSSIQKLVRECLKEYWTPTNRLIRGFINRHDCETGLISKPNGTFLLRFSETALGCLSIAYTVTDRFNQKVILNLAPFNIRDLSIRSLPDRINDLKDLTYLYPDIPKDNAFGSFYKSVEKSGPVPKGYVKSVLVTQVEGWDPFRAPSDLCSLEPVESIPSNQFYQNPITSNYSDFAYSPVSAIFPGTYIENDIDRLVKEAEYCSSPSLNQMTQFISDFEY